MSGSKLSHLAPSPPRGAQGAPAAPWRCLAGIGRALAAFSRRFPQALWRGVPGCGVNENHWSAEGWRDMKLSKTAASSGPLKQKINVIDGLYVKA